MFSALDLIFSQSADASQRLLALGRQLESQGRLFWAEWIFQRVVQRGSPSSAAFYHLGQVQTRRGKLQEARANLARSLELKPDFYLCRVSFFEICRQEYWTFHPEVLAQVEQQLAGPEATPELRFRRLHLLLSGGLFQQMRFEVARLDYDDLENSVYDRLEAPAASPRGSAGERKRFARRLEETRGLFERLEAELENMKALYSDSVGRRARLILRKRPPVLMVGLQDCDALIGYHLEVISGGKLSFLGLERLRRVDFGLHSDFIEATVELIDGSDHHVVVPATYYGSKLSTMEELRHGEFTIFKDLYHGIQLGVGRRVFTGRGLENGEPLAIGIHEVSAIEFLD